ncbi:MAG TPA: hypothetical protein VKB93_10110 [Thermoanaerobaculia bacterium]|nr:hypothetical protein [Thermoanaerobaculia bacterium]
MIVLLALVACSALSLLALGIPAAAVKDVLMVIYPPIVALAASVSTNEKRRAYIPNFPANSSLRVRLTLSSVPSFSRTA